MDCLVYSAMPGLYLDHILPSYISRHARALVFSRLSNMVLNTCICSVYIFGIFKGDVFLPNAFYFTPVFGVEISDLFIFRP